MTDIRMITKKQFTNNMGKCLDCDEYIEGPYAHCSKEKCFNSLPKLEDVRECLEAIVETNNIARCYECGEGKAYMQASIIHLKGCPVTKAKAILEKIGG